MDALDGSFSRLDDVLVKTEVKIEAAIANDSSRICGGGIGAPNKLLPTNTRVQAAVQQCLGKLSSCCAYEYRLSGVW